MSTSSPPANAEAISQYVLELVDQYKEPLFVLPPLKEEEEESKKKSPETSSLKKPSSHSASSSVLFADIFSIVCDYLDLKDLVRCRLVNKTLYKDSVFPKLEKYVIDYFRPTEDMKIMAGKTRIEDEYKYEGNTIVVETSSWARMVMFLTEVAGHINARCQEIRMKNRPPLLYRILLARTVLPWCNGSSSFLYRMRGSYNDRLANNVDAYLEPRDFINPSLADGGWTVRSSELETRLLHDDIDFPTFCDDALEEMGSKKLKEICRRGLPIYSFDDGHNNYRIILSLPPTAMQSGEAGRFLIYCYDEDVWNDQSSGSDSSDDNSESNSEWRWTDNSFVKLFMSLNMANDEGFSFEPDAYLQMDPRWLVLWYAFLRSLGIEPFVSAKVDPSDLWATLMTNTGDGDERARKMKDGWNAAFTYYNGLQVVRATSA